MCVLHMGWDWRIPCRAVIQMIQVASHDQHWPREDSCLYCLGLFNPMRWTKYNWPNNSHWCPKNTLFWIQLHKPCLTNQTKANKRSWVIFLETRYWFYFYWPVSPCPERVEGFWCSHNHKQDFMALVIQHLVGFLRSFIYITTCCCYYYFLKIYLLFT